MTWSTLKQLRLAGLRWSAFELMFSLLVSAFTAPCSSFRSWAALQLEILALRHQIHVLRRVQRGRVQLTTADRVLWTT